MNTLNTILFDLDGTLIDTAPDMVSALNRMLNRHHKSTLPFAQVRNSVSRGSLWLVKLGFGDDLSEPELKNLQAEYLNIYAEGLCIDSRPFDGLSTILDTLDERNIRWGVVTNKPGWLTEPLLKQLHLFDRAACVVSGDTLPTRKPDPAPLIHAAQLLQCPVESCVYIGDDRRDVVAARAAGMGILAVEYGYIEPGENPRDWGADAIIANVEHLQDWIRQHIL